jgi:FkbM family methyltransferase
MRYDYKSLEISLLRTRRALRLNLLFMPLVMPYFVVRRSFRFFFGPDKNLRIFREAGLGSTLDYLEKLRVPPLVRPWMENRTRFAIEKPVAEAAERVRGKIFIDVGAGFGYYSALLSKNFQTVLAFEPHPQTLEMLKSTIRVGKIRNVRISDRAVSDADGEVEFYLDSIRGQHSLESKLVRAEPLRVRSVRLDSVVSELVDLVKVDVEGAELKVIKGAEQSINAGNIRRWIVEVHSDATGSELERLLRSRRYETRWLDSRHVLASLEATPK